MHKTCKCKCRLGASVCNNKQRWNEDKCKCECKNLIHKGICDKEFIQNPSNCECKRDKPCDVGEYLDYKNCKCRKMLVDKLVEECAQNIDEVKLAMITLAEHEYKYENQCKSSCTLYIVLFSIIFIIDISIGPFFVYYKYVNQVKEQLQRRFYFSINNVLNI